MLSSESILAIPYINGNNKTHIGIKNQYDTTTPVYKNIIAITEHAVTNTGFKIIFFIFSFLMAGIRARCDMRPQRLLY